jgi:hypothetical protein
MAGVAAVALAATSAYAYWSSSGTATGATTLADGVSITATGTATGLYPGGTFALALTVNRVGLPALTVQTVSGPSGSVSVSGAPGCTDPDVTVNFTASPAQTAVFPADQTTTISLPAAVHMGPAAQNACQGGTFTFPVTVTAVQ